MRARLSVFGLCLSLTLTAAAARADILPQFQGSWFGPCTLTQVDGSVLEVTLHLAIAPLSATEVSWTLTYQGETLGTLVKSYSMRAVDLAAHHYVLDENNGILIDEYLFGNRLISSFDVGNDTRLASSTEVDGDQLYFENVAYGARVENRTRGGGTSVLSFAAQSIEACNLSRQ